MKKLIEAMANHTDCNPWYWLSYGEKCYAFACVEAITLKAGDEYPKHGTRLEPHEDKDHVWVGENGTEMMINEWIADVERQNGDTICAFIAGAYAKLMGPHLPTKDE